MRLEKGSPFRRKRDPCEAESNTFVLRVPSVLTDWLQHISKAFPKQAWLPKAFNATKLENLRF